MFEGPMFYWFLAMAVISSLLLIWSIVTEALDFESRHIVMKNKWWIRWKYVPTRILIVVSIFFLIWQTTLNSAPEIILVLVTIITIIADLTVRLIHDRTDII